MSLSIYSQELLIDEDLRCFHQMAMRNHDFHKFGQEMGCIVWWNIPKIIDGPINYIQGFGESHNWKNKNKKTYCHICLIWRIIFSVITLTWCIQRRMYLKPSSTRTIMDVKRTQKNKYMSTVHLNLKDVCNRPQLELVKYNGHSMMFKPWGTLYMKFESKWLLCCIWLVKDFETT